MNVEATNFSFYQKPRLRVNARWHPPKHKSTKQIFVTFSLNHILPNTHFLKKTLFLISTFSSSFSLFFLFLHTHSYPPSFDPLTPHSNFSHTLISYIAHYLLFFFHSLITWKIHYILYFYLSFLISHKFWRHLLKKAYHKWCGVKTFSWSY